MADLTADKMIFKEVLIRPLILLLILIGALFLVRVLSTASAGQTLIVGIVVAATVLIIFLRKDIVAGYQLFRNG